MGEVFYAGENKKRPGVYYRVDRSDEAAADSLLGVCGCVFKADYGPLNEVVEVTRENYAQVFGTELTADVLKYLFLGGASTVMACRIGDGGTPSSVTLTGTGTITSKYVGAKTFSVKVRERLGDASLKEIIIYDGTKIFEKYVIEAGGDEASALAAAMAASRNFSFTKTAGAGDNEITGVEQEEFTPGTNPNATATTSYSAGFKALEGRKMNVLAVDNEDPAVHVLLQAFIQSLADNVRFTMAVVTEKTSHTLTYETKMENAAGFNDPYMVYILNPYLMVNGNKIDGYQTAALAAGLISSYPCRYSMTHKVLDAASEILEDVPNSILNAAPLSGCIALTLSSDKKVWLDCGVNTLVDPPGDMDDGWKTIRRVKTRAELMERTLSAIESLIGNVDNDSTGRATVVTVAQGVINSMIAEGSLSSGNAYVSTEEQPNGNTAYFGMNIVDKESVEKIYFTFRFQFSVN